MSIFGKVLIINCQESLSIFAIFDTLIAKRYLSNQRHLRETFFSPGKWEDRFNMKFVIFCLIILFTLQLVGSGRIKCRRGRWSPMELPVSDFSQD